MDRLGHASLLCTLLLSALQVCSGAVKVQVTPMIEVIKGETAVLPCSFTVDTPSSNAVVEWYIDGVENRKRVAFRYQDGSSATIDKDSPLFDRVSIGDDFSLTITSTMPTDERNFYCLVNALVSGTGEDTTMLKVFYAPEAPELTRAASQAITADSSTSSEIGECVTKNGLPQPRIIWFKDDKPLPEVKDTKESTYMLPAVTKEASGMFTVKSTLYMRPTKADKDSKFHCMVEYSMPGKAIDKKQSNTISINLNYPSETATFSLVNTGPIKEGDTVTMKCETDGNPQPEFEFTKDDKPVTAEGGLLVLKSVKRTDVGVYKCTGIDFDNLDADLTGEINLSSISYIDPVTVTPAGPLSAKLGDMVEMQCNTKASEAHTVEWKKGSEVLGNKGVLSIKSVTYDNAGEYMCVGAVPSVPGLTAMASLNLTVTGKPMIDTPVNGEVMKKGESVTLKCSAHGNPAPQFTWKPSGKESVEVQGNMVVSTVTLETTDDVMANGVICETTNEHGTDSKTFAVTLKAGTNAIVLLSENPVLKADAHQGTGSSGVVIAVVVCVLLLLLLVALLYFLNKKDKLPCGKKDKKDMATGEVNNHGDIVVEMKTENPTEEAGLLKRPANEQ